jgi:hypothetical protein
MDRLRPTPLPGSKDVVSDVTRCESSSMPNLCTVDEAVALVRPVDRIGFGLGPGIPDELLGALGARDDWEDLQLGGALRLNLYEIFTKPAVSYRCGFFGPAERFHHSQGHRVGLPGGFRQMGPTMARFAPRVMMAQAAPPEGGSVNLSLHVGGTRDELLRAGRDPDRLLIVEVNANLTRTMSLPPAYDNTIALDTIDVLVESDGTPFALTAAPTDAVDEAVAAHALAYVATGRRCRRVSAPSPTSWLRSSPAARWVGSAFTPRCSQRA